MRCLIVEDVDPVSADLEVIVKRFGIGEVDTANSISQALQLAADNIYDVALVDLHISKSSALPVVEILRAGQTGVAVVTGGLYDVPDCIKNLPTVSKPYGEASIHDALNSLIRAKAEFRRILIYNAMRWPGN